MTFTMEIYVNGGCRGNGQPGSYGAAAACFKLPSGGWLDWTRELPQRERPTPTNQRAEILAIIIALHQALQRYDNLYSSPRLEVKIYSDSTCIIECMKNWIYEWRRNGWIDAAGNPVVNQDLLKEASDLHDRLRNLGTVEYNLIPRAENEHAGWVCNDSMNSM